MSLYRKVIGLIFSVLLIFGSMGIFSVAAVDVPDLSTETKSVIVGDQFTVNVLLANTSSVYGGNFTLQYDSSLLTADSFSYGSIMGSHTKNCNLNYQSAGNLIRFTFSGAEALPSDGTLVTITFTAKAEGTAALRFNAYKMYDENGSSITSAANGSNVTIASKSVVSPTLSVANKTVNVDDTVSVPVVISNSDDVYGGNFTLQYDSNLLTADSFSYGSIVESHTKNCNLNYQSSGNLIRFTFSGTEALPSDGMLITITFTAKAAGTAVLSFNAYKMYDANGSSIDTSVSSGSVVISSYTHTDTTKPNASISTTNNVADYQNVTLNLSDNIGVVSYYFGTNSSPSSSNFISITSATNTTVKMMITGSGPFYLFAKDAAGNISESESILFYKTSFNANGGTVYPSNIVMLPESSFALPTAIRDGYTFLGWSTISSATNATYKQGDSFTANSNTTLYAVWSKNPYTVTLYSGFHKSTTKTILTTGDFFFTEPASISGWTTLGWREDILNDSASYPPTGSTTVSSDTVYYAVYSKSISITYNANGGIGAPSVQKTTIYMNSSGRTNMINLSATQPVRTGYTFLGWSTSSNATSATYSSDSNVTIESDTTLYAVWSKNPTYTLTYDANGGTGAPSNQVGATNYVISSIIPSRNGYSFGGWATSRYAIVPTYSSGDNITLAKSITLYALWISNIEQLRIKNPSTSTINYGETLVMHADFGGVELPEGWKIEWTVEGAGFNMAPAADGLTCKMTSVANGNATVKATLVDENGEIVLDADGNEMSDTQELKSNASFWQKIVSFFKNLFRINRIIPE